MNDYVVIRSELIADAREARRYYEERMAGRPHTVSCHGRPATLFFDKAVNHVYTTDAAKSPGASPVIRRRLAGGNFDERVFCIDRARLIDHILPAVSYFTFTLPGTGPRSRHSRLVHGPRLADGRYLRVVLATGPKGMWYCKSAYPIEGAEWMRLRSAKTVKFPP